MPGLPCALPGLVVERVSTTEPTLLIDARTRTPAVCCPACHTPAARGPSRDTRRQRHLPVAASPVPLRVPVRRFRWRPPPWARQPWAERLPALAPGHAPRPARGTETGRVRGGEAGGGSPFAPG